MPKVLIVAPSRRCQGGITSVIQQIEQTYVWQKFNCRWLETQINTTYPEKIRYFLSSILIALFVLPRYKIIHFHTVPGISLWVQMPVFMLALIWRKRTIVHLHVGNQLAQNADSKTFRFVLRHATRIVVLANIWKQSLQTHFSALPPIDVLYNPAPITNRQLPAHSTGDKYIIFIAYLTKNKGYDTLLQAFASLRPAHPDWRLVIAGTGEVHEARAIARDLNITDCVEFAGWVDGRRKDELFRNASCFCLASYMEGFPMSVLEAWAHRVPVVTTLAGGLPDVVTDGVNALTFPAGDAKRLSSQLSRIMESPSLADTLTENGQQTISSYFSLEKVAGEWEQLYNNTI